MIDQAPRLKKVTIELSGEQKQKEKAARKF